MLTIEIRFKKRKEKKTFDKNRQKKGLSHIRSSEGIMQIRGFQIMLVKIQTGSVAASPNRQRGRYKNVAGIRNAQQAISKMSWKNHSIK